METKNLNISDVMKCPFCGGENIEPSMFIEEFDCNDCLKPFKEKDFS
jgi:transposase-like protein